MQIIRRDTDDTKLPGWLTLGVTVICVAPLPLMLLGVDFATQRTPLDPAAVLSMSPGELMDAQFASLRGAFAHTLFEWSAFAAAIFTVVLALAHFRVQGDVTTPIICVALFCAGMIDVFHTLAADRLIEAVADNGDLIPFTWAVCRVFNALIVLIGVGMFLVAPKRATKRGFGLVIGTSVVFGVIAYVIIHLAATSPSLPQTMFPDSLIKRPYDFGPLLLFIFAGVYVFPRFYRRAPSLFSYSLIVSTIPEVATEAYMAFGSTALFDASFNIAHFLKILGYLVPFAGLLCDYLRTYQRETRHRGMLDAIVRNTPDAMFTVDSGGLITSANAQTAEIFGYDPDELRGLTVDRLIPDLADLPWRVRCGVREGEDLENLPGASRTQETVARRRDNTEFAAEVTFGIARVGEEAIFTGILRDIEERKRMEHMKAEFISIVSHELRTPLTSIQGSLGLLLGGAAGKLHGQSESLVQIAHNNSSRLIRLINDILDIEKMEAGKMEFDMRPHDLAPLVNRAIADNRGVAEALGRTIVLEDSAERAESIVDSDRFAQVMSNLISNALKFSPKGGAVRVALKQFDGYVRVSVSDDGDGIPEEFRPRVFLKFNQAATADSREKGGTGLGLSISRSIVERMNGTIDFITGTGMGTTFFFDLPEIATSRAAEVDADVDILICEDDPEMAKLIGLILSDAGYVCDIVYGPVEAKAMLAQRSYRAMTLDIMLRAESGLTLLQELRDEGIGEDVPIVLVSLAADQARGKLNSDNIDVAAWIQKPIDPDHLLATIERAARRDRADRPRILHVEDDAELSKVIGVVLRDDAEVICAGTVSRARALLNRNAYDLVLLDLAMPDADGRVLIDKINRIDPSVPILIFSAEEVSEETSRQVAGTLVKSRTSNDELAATVRRLLEGSVKTAATTAATAATA